MIYPKITKSRMVFDLNGIWDFRFLEEGEEYGGKNQEGEEFLPMPVPSSYNDIYPGRDFADHVGNMLYTRTFTVTVCQRHPLCRSLAERKSFRRA